MDRFHPTKIDRFLKCIHLLTLFLCQKFSWSVKIASIIDKACAMYASFKDPFKKRCAECEIFREKESFVQAKYQSPNNQVSNLVIM